MQGGYADDQKEPLLNAAIRPAIVAAELNGGVVTPGTSTSGRGFLEIEACHFQAECSLLLV